MSPQLRLGGRAALPDGDEVIWSVADGRRGRRWRAETIHAGAIISSLLLELDVDGRPSRLELGTANGLLTLHPESTGALHGNAVTPDGIRHLAFDWSDEHALEIEGSVIARAVTASRLAGTTPVGEGRLVPIVAVGLDLEVRAGERHYRRLDATMWRVGGDGDAERFTVDARGLPIWPAAAGEWPLELDTWS
jgi:hypothetical protein